MKIIGFVGVGYMGYGIAKNILKHKNNLFFIANKNRKPIDKIVGVIGIIVFGIMFIRTEGTKKS